ncbi:hypothetical protein M9434_002454 [Picochlorum sp. BPE23]|nr:hypothetical protein M9434_002454 [Picochlorum sp. BPE23]
MASLVRSVSRTAFISQQQSLFARSWYTSTSCRFGLDELIGSTPTVSPSSTQEDIVKQHQATNASVTGRAWQAEDLRRKSWDDLHRLWVALYKERNALHAEKLEWRRLGQRMPQATRFSKVRLSMNRIKQVMSERARDPDMGYDANTRAYLKAFIDAM